MSQVYKVVESRNAELALRIVDAETGALKADASAVRVLVTRLLSDLDLELSTVVHVQQLLADQLGVSCSDMISTWGEQTESRCVPQVLTTGGEGCPGAHNSSYADF